MAYLIAENRTELGKDKFTELRVYEVPHSKDFQEGLKYSMSYVKKGQCILRYDNERGKGHHMHFMGKESEVSFRAIWELISEFRERVKELGGGLSETDKRNNQG